MKHAEDTERLIQEVITELGSDADSKTIAARVRKLDLGLPAEDEFTAICSWLGKSRLIHKLDQLQVPLQSREFYQVPDLLVVFENSGPLLIEVKSNLKQTLSLRPDYLKRLNNYAKLVKMPLLIAWKFNGIWVLFEVRHLAIARKNFNIKFDHAMRENLLGVLAGDVLFKIAPGAGVRVRCKKEKLLSVDENDSTLTKEWLMRIDKVEFTTAGGKSTADLDSEVKTLFTAWDLTYNESHNESHIDFHYVAGEEDGSMFGHMALKYLLNWTLPVGAVINWRHVIRRDSIVTNMTNFRQTLQKGLAQNVVKLIIHQQPKCWPDFL